MTRLLGLIVILIFPIRLLAQAPNLTGKVLNKETNAVVVGVSISVYDERDIIYRTTSDSTGSFNIPINLLTKINHVKITSFNFDDLLIKSIPRNLDDKKSFIGTFAITPHVIKLSEVKVKANKRYRDTTKISFSDQHFERSVMIDDIFSTNGFSKDANGQLYYKGKVVSDLRVNGGDFFGKNNKDVYHLLPALVLDNVEVIETNIDSTTNTTTLRPAIKVNLKFKKQYNKGNFGNASAGLGTSDRYLAATGLYTYKNKEQISLTLNSNNINLSDMPLAEPAISFSINGNNVKTNNIKLTYNNTIAKKVEVEFSAKGRIENRAVTSESERQDQTIDQYSKTTNKSNSKLYGVTDPKLKMTYKIDSLNTLQLTQTGDYNKNKVFDSLNYIISSDGSVVLSDLSRGQEITNKHLTTDLDYKRLFSSKKGRGLFVTLNRANSTEQNNELDNVYTSSNGFSNEYYVDGKRGTSTNTYTVNANYTEPLSDNSFLNVFTTYKSNAVNYNSKIVSDSLTNFLNTPVSIRNQYVQTGFKIQNTFSKVSLDAVVAALLNKRDNRINGEANDLSFFNLNVNLKAEYKINKKRDITAMFGTGTNYPELNQLINVNTSYDLISQMGSNLKLKPEIKNSLQVVYRIKTSDSEIFSIDGDINYYSNKFGLNTHIIPNTPQSIYVDNIGHAITIKLGSSLQRNTAGKFNINYFNSFSYLEQPTIINNKLILNNGFINQGISTSKNLIKNVLTVAPTLAVTYSKYFYETSTSSIFNLIYSDRFSLLLAKFEVNLYPLINYSHNLNTLTSFSVNGGIKRTIFNTGTIWLQGYDLFNSFKYNSNFFGSSYIQSIKYSNVTRYFIIGLSFNFNNIK
jgi:hypothetical protein